MRKSSAKYVSFHEKVTSSVRLLEHCLPTRSGPLVVQPTSCFLSATVCQPGNYVHRYSYSWSNHQWELKVRDVCSAKPLQLSGTACRTKLVMQRHTDDSGPPYELNTTDWLSSTDHVTVRSHDSSFTHRLKERYKIHLIIIIIQVFIVITDCLDVVSISSSLWSKRFTGLPSIMHTRQYIWSYMVYEITT